MSKKKGGSAVMVRETIAWLFVIPALACFILFKYYPILLGFFVSFFKVNIVSLPGDFIGFDNYRRAFMDPDFRKALINTVQFMGIALIFNFWVPIFLALMINEVRKGRTFMRTMYFIPAVAPGIAMSVLWKYIWQPDYGLANALMRNFGWPIQKWLNDPNLVKWCMLFPGLLIGGGLTMIIYLAALQDVPQEQHESALVDGAGFVRRIISISLPQIAPIVMTMLVLAIIDIFNMFDNVQVMTGGGPNGASETMVLYAYKQAYTFLNYGYAITLSCITFLVVFALTAIQMVMDPGSMLNQLRGGRKTKALAKVKGVSA